MLSITENNYIATGEVKYEDQYGNEAVFRKNATGFYAKLKLRNNLVKVDPVKMKVPMPKDVNGITLNVTNETGIPVYTDDVVKGQEYFVSMIKHWIALITNTKRLGLSKSIIANSIGAEGPDREELAAEYQIFELSQYDELRDALQTAIYGNAYNGKLQVSPRLEKFLEEKGELI